MAPGGLVLRFGEGAPQDGLDAEHGEIRAGHQLDIHRFEARASAHRAVHASKQDTQHGADVGEDLILLPHLTIERIGIEVRKGEVVGAATRPPRSKQDELSGVLDRQFAQHDGVQQAEDGGVGSNPQGQRQHRDGHQARAAQHGPQAVTQVLP